MHVEVLCHRASFGFAKARGQCWSDTLNVVLSRHVYDHFDSPKISLESPKLGNLASDDGLDQVYHY
jgi:hypothetical protein